MIEEAKRLKLENLRQFRDMQAEIEKVEKF